MKCVNLEVSVLMNIEDVTGTVTPAMTNDEAERGRRSATNEIGKESMEKTGLRSEVVKLFQGG
jgi:hypothetical protein